VHSWVLGNFPGKFGVTRILSSFSAVIGFFWQEEISQRIGCMASADVVKVVRVNTGKCMLE